MRDKVKEQITLSDNKLGWFSGADLPHSRDPTYIPNTVSFGLDFIINHLQVFFQTVLLRSPLSFLRRVWGSRPSLLPQLSDTAGGGSKAKCDLVISCDIFFL